MTLTFEVTLQTKELDQLSTWQNAAYYDTTQKLFVVVCFGYCLLTTLGVLVLQFALTAALTVVVYCEGTVSLAWHQILAHCLT